MLPPVGKRSKCGKKPEQGADEVDPDGVLHALHGSNAMRVLIDVHLCEDVSAYLRLEIRCNIDRAPFPFHWREE